MAVLWLCGTQIGSQNCTKNLLQLYKQSRAQSNTKSSSTGPDISNPTRLKCSSSMGNSSAIAKYTSATDRKVKLQRKTYRAALGPKCSAYHRDRLMMVASSREYQA